MKLAKWVFVLTFGLLVILSYSLGRLVSAQPSLPRINWLEICRTPVVDKLVVEPCESLTSPDGYTLTSEGQKVLACLLLEGVAKQFFKIPEEEIKLFVPVAGCGTTTPAFLTYENSTREIKIDYPKDWTPMIQYGLAFLSPKEDDSDTLREGLTVAKSPHGTESLSILAARVVKFYNSSVPNFKLVESKGTTIHGNPAQSLVYTFDLPGNGTIKVLESGTIENNNIYVFRYVAQESKYDSYLPTINRMIESFSPE